MHATCYARKGDDTVIKFNSNADNMFMLNVSFA